MQTKHGDTLNTQLNTEKTLNPNSRLIEYKEIENTPFTLVHNEEGYFITIGNYKLTHLTQTEDEQLKMLQEKTWDIIGAFVIAIMETRFKIRMDVAKMELEKQDKKTDRGSEADLE